MAAPQPAAAGPPPHEEGLAFLTEDELEAEGGLEGNPDVGTMGTMGSGSSLTNNFICQASHPAVAFFHLAFKVAALLVYILSGWFTTGFVTPFVIIILLLAADFWTVKNVSGRLLVGLRWWNKINEDGSNHWVYESHPDAEKTVPYMNKRIFWGGMYAAVLMWLALAVLNVLTLSLDWLVVTLTGLALTGANLQGYLRCSQEADKRRSSAAQAGAAGTSGLAGAAAIASLPGVLPSIANSITSSIFAGLGGAAPAPAPEGTGATAQPRTPGGSGMRGDVSGQSMV